MIIIATHFLKNYSGIALWPFLLVINRTCKHDPVFINHERTHARQQQELFIVPFFIWYVLEYDILLLFRNHDDAYRNIVFERQAHATPDYIHYLKNHSWYVFLKFYRKKYTL
jgi:hypothetical protein